MKKIGIFISIIMLTILHGFVLDAQFQLVANINTSLKNDGSFPESFIKYRGDIFFGAYDFHGPGIWKTDGTESGTELVTHKAVMNEVIIYKDHMLFIGRDQFHYYGLWLSDGTEDGTTLLHNFKIANIYAFKSQLSPVGDKVIFRFYNENAECGLWITDGTTEGTRILKDPELKDASPGNLTIFTDKLIFVADDEDNGRSLWQSDGSPEGTEIVKDLNLSFSPETYGFTECHGKIYFIGKNNTSIALYSTDGTETGTGIIDVIPGKLRPFYYSLKHLPEIAIFNDTLYFALFNPDPHPVHSLWKVSGDSLMKVFEFDPLNEIVGLFSLPDKLVWMVANPWTSGGTLHLYLWKMDAAGIQNYYDIQFTSWETDEFEAVVDDAVIYFNYGSIIWKTDGTQEGTVRITNDCYLSRSSYKKSFYLLDGTLLFSGSLLNSIGSEPWISDGTAGGTKLIKDINQTPSYYGIEDPFVFKDKLYFTVTMEQYGKELWVSDGTSSGTGILKDINPEGNSDPASFVEFNGNLFFTASESMVMDYLGVGYPSGLWKTDGSETGTIKIKDIATRFSSTIFPGVSACPGKVQLGEKFLFTAAIPLIFDSCDVELWESDGTAEGTRLLKNIDPGMEMINNYGKPNLYTPAGDIVFFAATTKETGTELWKTDGTPDGTLMISDLCSGPASSLSYDPAKSNLISFGNSLIFTPFDSIFGYELWISDGAEAGTHLIKDINSGTLNTSVLSPLVISNTMFFGTDDGIHGTELWKTDGTEAGTSLMKDINPSGSGFSKTIGEFNDICLFVADDGFHGYELWRSDGTSDGTNLFLDSKPGPYGGGVMSFVSLENKFFFTTGDESRNTHLWMSDGTTEGTNMMADWPSSKVSGTGKFVVLYNSLYFTALHEEYGQAFFKYDFSNTSINTIHDNRITVYPNPVQNELFIKSEPGSHELFTIRILDLAGKTLHDANLRPENEGDIRINTSQFKPGIYLLIINSGKTFKVSKFVKL